MLDTYYLHLTYLFRLILVLYIQFGAPYIPSSVSTADGACLSLPAPLVARKRAVEPALPL